MTLLSREQAPILARDWYRADGSASALTRSLAHAPDMLETLMPFLGQIMGESAVDLAAKELVIMRVSALDAGVTEAQLQAVCDVAKADGLTPREQAIIAWVDQQTTDAAGVTDGLVAATLDHVRADQLIELTVLAGTITMLNQYCTAFQIPPPRVDL